MVSLYHCDTPSTTVEHLFAPRPYAQHHIIMIYMLSLYSTKQHCIRLVRHFAAYLGATSVPVTIPSGGYQRGRVSSISQSPPSASPLGNLTAPPLGNLTAPGFFPATEANLRQQQKQEQQLQEVRWGTYNGPLSNGPLSNGPMNNEPLSGGPLSNGSLSNGALSNGALPIMDH